MSFDMVDKPKLSARSRRSYPSSQWTTKGTALLNFKQLVDQFNELGGQAYLDGQSKKTQIYEVKTIAQL